MDEKLGFTKDHILIVTLIDKNIRENLFAFKQEMLKNPGVNRVSFSRIMLMALLSGKNCIKKQEPNGHSVPFTRR